MSRRTRIATALGTVLAAGTLTAGAALASPPPGSGAGGTLLRSTIGGSQPSDPHLFGAAPGGAPWIISDSSARVSQGGRLHVEVEGLVIPGRGNPVPTLSASLACNGTVVATTAAAPFDAAGNAEIDAAVAVPARCLAPALLLNPNGNPGVFIAATGR